MNLDTLRAIQIGASDDRLGLVAGMLVQGRYSMALERLRVADLPDTLPGLELSCLVLFANGHLAQALAQAEMYLARAEAASLAQGPARRTLAERLWNIDLRQSYARVRSLLAIEDDPNGLDDVERFRRRVLLADYAQCRGDYELAAVCLHAADDLHDALGGASRAAGQVDLELARCRSLQGRRNFDEAFASIERGLAAAERSASAVGRIRLLIRRARTFFMIGDRPAGWQSYQEAVLLHDRCQRRPDGAICWEEVRTEVAFTGGELALYDRRPATAERYLRTGSVAALGIGSHEGYAEAAVMLAASLIMQERPEEALAQYRIARELCADECYHDLAGDLDKLARSRRFQKISAISAATDGVSAE